MTGRDELWRIAVENANDIIVITDADSGRILEVNPAACRALGRPREGLLGMRQTDLHPPEQQAAARRIFIEAASGVRVTSAETTLVSADGSPIPVEVGDRAFHLGGRQVVIQVFRDLRERRRAEAAMAETQARQEAVLRLSPLGVQFFHLEDDQRLILTDANPTADRILGCAGGAGIGLTFEEAFPGFAGTPLPANYRHCAETGEPWSSPRVDFDRAGAQVSFEVHVFRYAERRIAVQFIDITDRVRLEDRLRHGERLEAIGRLAGGVAHDFNNHLTAIIGHAELITATCEEPRINDWARTIATAAERAAGLTRQLLTFSRRGQVRAEPIDVNRLVREAAALLAGSLSKLIRLDLDLPPASPGLRGDASQISSALINLVLNAADAMSGGGTVTISSGAVRLEQKDVLALYGHPKPGHYIRISVIDQGRGIDPAVREHLFEPFTTTKKDKGTGLGLASVFGAVVGHRGGIAVDSTPGKGTTVSLFLPARSTALTQPVSERIVAGPVSARILVVDDEPAVRRVLFESLVSLGCSVDEADGGAAAMRQWAAHGPYDLVLLDLLMPEIPGEQVFRSLRDASPTAKILIVSGHGPGGVVQRLLNEGAIGFLPKPFTFGRLAEAVRAALKKK